MQPTTPNGNNANNQAGSPDPGGPVTLLSQIGSAPGARHTKAAHKAAARQKPPAKGKNGRAKAKAFGAALIGLAFLGALQVAFFAMAPAAAQELVASLTMASSVPWLTVTNSPNPVSGSLTIAATPGLTSHQVIGTCGSATSFGPCSLTGADMVISDANGGNVVHGETSELLTLSTSSTTTTGSSSPFPANSVIEAVVCRVTTTITTAANWEVGDGTTVDRFVQQNTSLTATNTVVGTNFLEPAYATTNAKGPVQGASAAQFVVTTNANAGAGAIRCTSFWRTMSPPTS